MDYKSVVAKLIKSDELDKSEILAALNREYNHARQSEITTEINEISSGAKFQRSKKNER